MTVLPRQVVTYSLLFILYFIAPSGYAEEHTEESPPTETSLPEKQSKTLNVLQFHELTIRLPKRLIEVQEQLSDLPKASYLQNEIAEARQQLEYLEWKILQALSNPHLSMSNIYSLDGRIIRLRSGLERLDSRVVKQLRLIESLHMEWLEIEASLQEQELSTEEKEKRLVTSEDIDNLEELVAQAQKLIRAQVSPVVQTGRQIAELQTRVFSVQKQLDGLAEEQDLSGFEQTSPSMFSGKYYRHLYNQLFGQGMENTLSILRFQLGTLTEKNRFIVVSVALCLAIILTVRSSRRLAPPASRWHPFAARPVATGVFLYTMLLLVYDILTVSVNLVVDSGFLLLVPLVLSIGRFADLLFKDAHWQRLLKDISLILALSFFVAFLGFSQTILFLALLFLCVFYVFYRMVLPQLGGKKSRSKYSDVVQWPTVLFVSVVIVLGILGYDILALRLFSYTLSIFMNTAAVVLLFIAISSLLEFSLGSLPITFIKKNAGHITKHIEPLLIVIIAALWLANVLPLLGLYPTLNSAFQAITSAQYTIGSTTVTGRLLFKILLTAYLAWIISRTLRVILQEQTFPKYKVEPGAQHSILRLINYTIVMVFILVILNILGVGLGKLAIVGGALSVGIGFGLQAIVNNFVSGLIMLFERPIKIGDVIVVEGELGVVKSLGLRSTTVQTFDNAEIVLPNSELVTKNVTNWTLAEQRARARIPIGVAYGSDIEKVISILLSCADENPRVLYEPKPLAVFLSFGESSLDFELRVFVNDFYERVLVISELNQEIESEFAAHGIEIPFPQRDLHVKSVDGEVVAALAT